MGIQPLESQSIQSVPSVWLAIDNFFNGLFATLLGATALILAVMGFKSCLAGGSLPQIMTAGMIVIWMAVVELPFILSVLLLTARSGSLSVPLMLYVAKNQIRWPTPMRPLVCVWWLLHLLISLILPLSIVIEHPMMEPSLVTYMAILTAILCGLSFGFAIKALACFDRNRQRLKMFWSWRMWWGIACGIAFAITGVVVN